MIKFQLYLRKKIIQAFKILLQVKIGINRLKRKTSKQKFDAKVDQAFKILVYTKSKEILSNDVHVKQMSSMRYMLHLVFFLRI